MQTSVGGDVGVGGDLDRGVAVAAIDAEFTGVQRVLKPDRLRYRDADAVTVGTRKDHKRRYERDDEDAAADKTPFGEGVGVGGQKLRHQQDTLTGRPPEYWSQRTR